MKALTFITLALISTSSLAEDIEYNYDEIPSETKSWQKVDPHEYRSGSFSQPWREYHHDYGGQERCDKDPQCHSDGHRAQHRKHN